MESTTRLLVVANRTADSDELFTALRERSRRGPIAVTLLMPQDSRGGMGRRLNAGLRRLHEADIEAEGMLGDVDPIVAVQEVWESQRFDEVVVSTLHPDVSRWVDLELPERIAKVTGAPVTHVVSTEVGQRTPATTA